MSKTIFIGGRLESKEKGNVVAGANAIKDDTKGKMQNVINKETDDELLRLEQSKQDNLNFDNTPTEDSTNPVTSGGVYTAEKALSDAIEAILLLIPSAATALNKLVDTNTMNSSISTATATFRGTYNAVSDLGLTYQATHAQIEAALDALGLTADNNDYAFVQVPVSDQSQDIAKTERYKNNGTNWQYEYDLNTSGFTAAQWGAINSTITLALVQKLAALPTNAELLQALGLKQDVLTFDNAPTTDSNNPVKSGGIKTAIDTAVGDEATARENADTALGGLIGDEKTRAEGAEGGLDTRLDAVEGSVSTIQGVIPSEATSSNKLVDYSSMTTYIGTIIDNMDVTFNVQSTDGRVTLHVTQEDGIIASVQVTTSDIASAADLTLLAGRVTSAEGNITSLGGRMTTAEGNITSLGGRMTTAEGNITSLGGRVSTNETDIANLQQLYNNLQQSKPVPVTALPSTGQQQGVIYRLAGTTSYSDYMWNGSTWVLMATYDNAIDDVPTAGSNNCVTSNGVAFSNENLNRVLNINLIDGVFVDGEWIFINGNKMENPTICRTNFINIKPSSVYCFSVYGIITFYDSNENFISGTPVHNSDNPQGTFTTPSNAALMQVGLMIEDKNRAILLHGTEPYDYLNIGFGDSYVLENNGIKHVITVGTGKQFTNLKDAISACVNPSENNRYLIELFESQVLAPTASELADNNYVGLMIPNYVKILGIGDRRQISITMSLDPSIDVNIRGRISPINLKQTSELENITIIGENTRYAVHDDFEELINVERVIENVKAISRNTVSHVAWGAGYRSGLVWHFNNCIFQNEENVDGASFAAHNNIGFQRAAQLYFKNCRFVVVSGVGARFGSLNDIDDGTIRIPIINQLYFYGNSVGHINLTEQNAVEYGKGIKVTVSGFGNDINNSDVSILNTDGVDYSSYVDLI